MGPAPKCPPTRRSPRAPFGDYGIHKAAIEAYLLAEARRSGFPATILHPGHIVGPGWAPLNPAGHFNPQVFAQLARGEELALPNLGMETVHHVHADDVAQAFMLALENWSNAVGESFHVVSPAALTLPRLRRSDGRLVWPAGAAPLSSVGRMAADRDSARGAGDLGSHCAQPQLRHCQGPAPVRLSAALQLAPGRAGSSHLASAGRQTAGANL